MGETCEVACANFGMSNITAVNFPKQKAISDSRSFLLLQLFSCVGSFPEFFLCGPLSCSLTDGSCRELLEREMKCSFTCELQALQLVHLC